ncbi:MAG: deoxyribonuclease IV [Armatimonadota bacterium]
MRLGFHVSIAGGLGRCIERAVVRRCTTMQMFTAAPVQWARGEIDPEEGTRFARGLASLDIRPHFVHAKYLLNVSSPDPQLRARSVADLCAELRAAQALSAAGVILHLGSVGAEGTIAEGIDRVARAVDAACERAADGPPVILENCAGQGNVVGARFCQLAAIIAATDCPQRVQVCIDTAHAFGTGYAIHEQDGLERALQEMDATFGLGRLALMHINDSLAPLGSGRDRHWHIGRGEIGRAAMARIVNHPALVHLPFIMETPGTKADDISNMRRIRRLIRPEHRPPLPPLPPELR